MWGRFSCPSRGISASSLPFPLCRQRPSYVRTLTPRVPAVVLSAKWGTSIPGRPKWSASSTSQGNPPSASFVEFAYSLNAFSELSLSFTGGFPSGGVGLTPFPQFDAIMDCFQPQAGTSPPRVIGLQRPRNCPQGPFAIRHSRWGPALTSQICHRSRPGSVSGRAACRCLHGPGPAFTGGRARFPIQRGPSASKDGSPGPPTAAPPPPGQRGDPANVRAVSGPSAPAPRRRAPGLEAAAPITELGRWPLSVRSARSRSKTPPGVAAGTQQPLVRSPAQRTQLCLNRPGDGTFLVDFLVGPSGARDLGVRHLQTLGHGRP
ncbi:hypothetical protein NDU88_004748 [Pleurodeles waltl]|uniref:Uncharacterized protein n=1 Tax=Pleurodeles waltl TaxID=8319 RepID=A0AAV7SJN3_PLEWA|nr:hypothetical protein NDU88_004748 [Pleurodeles waltl]